MPRAGIEPARPCEPRILSPVCLPVPSSRHLVWMRIDVTIFYLNLQLAHKVSAKSAYLKRFDLEDLSGLKFNECLAGKRKGPRQLLEPPKLFSQFETVAEFLQFQL